MRDLITAFCAGMVMENNEFRRVAVRVAGAIFTGARQGARLSRLALAGFAGT
jgi:hypothetical protein